jgi:hypothetical protein
MAWDRGSEGDGSLLRRARPRREARGARPGREEEDTTSPARMAAARPIYAGDLLAPRKAVTAQLSRALCAGDDGGGGALRGSSGPHHRASAMMQLATIDPPCRPGMRSRSSHSTVRVAS